MLAVGTPAQATGLPRSQQNMPLAGSAEDAAALRRRPAHIPASQEEDAAARSPGRSGHSHASQIILDEVALVDWQLHAFETNVRRTQSTRLRGSAAAPEHDSLYAVHHAALDAARATVRSWHRRSVLDPQCRHLWLWAAAAATARRGGGGAFPVARWRRLTLGLLGRRARGRLALASWRLAAARQALFVAVGRVAAGRRLERSSPGGGSPQPGALSLSPKQKSQRPLRRSRSHVDTPSPLSLARSGGEAGGHRYDLLHILSLLLM